MKKGGCSTVTSKTYLSLHKDLLREFSLNKRIPTKSSHLPDNFRLVSLYQTTISLSISGPGPVNVPIIFDDVVPATVIWGVITQANSLKLCFLVIDISSIIRLSGEFICQIIDCEIGFADKSQGDLSWFVGVVLQTGYLIITIGIGLVNLKPNPGRHFVLA